MPDCSCRNHAEPGLVQNELSGWPLSREALQASLGSRSFGGFLQPGKVRIEVRRLGRYVVLPCRRTPDGDGPRPDAAILLDVTEPGQVVPGTLRL